MMDEIIALSMVAVGNVLPSFVEKAVYDLGKKLIQEKLGGEAEELERKMAAAIAKASNKFFEHYGEQFGPDYSSFLASQKNWEKMRNLFRYDRTLLKPEDLDPTGFDGAPSATPEALVRMYDYLQDAIFEDPKLAAIFAEKKHQQETKKIVEKLDDANIKLDELMRTQMIQKATLKPRLVSQRSALTLAGPSDYRIYLEDETLGREADIEKIEEFLKADNGEKVLAVTGAAGIGKTTVCHEALRCFLTSSPQVKVLYIDLSSAMNAEVFLSRLAEACGLSSDDAGGSLERIAEEAERLANLVYLDNFEDVAADDRAIEVLDRLGRGLRILLSSREKLPGRAAHQELEPLGINHCVALFLLETKRSDPKFSVEDSAELRRFLEDCLGCHPLTIRLVAAQAYQCENLEELLFGWEKDALELAKRPQGKGRNDSLELSLKRSLRALANLNPLGPTLWAAAAYFSMGMAGETLSALARAVGGEPRSLKESLLRLHILQWNGETRSLSMLAPLREFVLRVAEKRMDGSLDFDVSAGIAYKYFLRIAESAVGARGTSAHQMKLDQLLRQFANIHFFVLRVSQSDDKWAEPLSALSWCLYNYYPLKPILGRDMLAQLLTVQRKMPNKRIAAQTCTILGDLKLRHGEIDETERLYREAEQLFRKERENLGLANTLKSLGDLKFRVGDLDAAERLYDEAERLYREEGENLGLASVLRSLGDLKLYLRQADRVEHLFREAERLYREERESLGLAYKLKSLGDLKLRVGEFNQAERLYDEAERLYQEERDELGLANTLKSLGDLKFSLGEITEAERLYDEAERLYRDVQDGLGLANTLLSLGYLKFSLGEVTEPERLYDEAERLYQEERHKLGLANTLKSMGDLKLKLGLAKETEKLYGKAERLYREVQEGLGLANTLLSLGELKFRLGQVEAAERLLDEAMRLYRAEHDDMGLAHTLWCLGDLKRLLGQMDEAERFFSEAERLYRAGCDNKWLAHTLLSLGDLEYCRGHLIKAKAKLLEAVKLFEVVQDHAGLALTCCLLAIISFYLDAHVKGEEYAQKALDMAQRSGAPGLLQFVKNKLNPN